MPGNHGEISVDEQNGGEHYNKKTRKKKKKKKKDDDVKEVAIADDFENANQLVKLSISETRKRFAAKIRKKPNSPKRCSSPSSHSGSRKGGCFSMMRPTRTEEPCSSSPPSDPNDESFTHEMLRVMIETNDFCSNECNPHR